MSDGGEGAVKAHGVINRSLCFYCSTNAYLYLDVHSGTMRIRSSVMTCQVLQAVESRHTCRTISFINSPSV